MATMAVKTHVEATPDLVAEHLSEYAKSAEALAAIAQFEDVIASARFPAVAGELIYLTDQAVAAFGALPNMPALVLSAPGGPSLALVAFATETDLIKTARVMITQVARKA